MSSNSNQLSERVKQPAELPRERARELYVLQKTAPADRRILHSWKEIANFLGRGVRTVQRYEAQLLLPVRRPAGTNRSAVLAFSDELDQWLKRAPKRERPLVKRVLLLLDQAPDGGLSARRLALEMGNFNVLAVSCAEEMFETSETFDVDGFVIDWDNAMAPEICESLSERHPNKPVFAIVPKSVTNGNAPHRADYIIASADPEKLLAVLWQVFRQREAA